MTRFNLFAGCCLFVLLAGCRRSEPTVQIVVPGNANAVIPKSVINAFVKKQLAEQQQFDWKMASDSMVWSALVQGDSVLSVGYQPADFKDLDKKINHLDLNSNEWTDARNTVLRIIAANEPLKTEKELLVFKKGKLPVMDVRVGNFATVKALRRSGLVRYAEPIGYGAFMQEAVHPLSSTLTFGCGNNIGKTDLVAGTDYNNITPAAKESWNYTYHHISQAWARSTGQNVKVMIIDTGISPDQENLGSAFNQGVSSGRTIQKLVTLEDATPNDDCGHGTSMAGALGGPRGTDGNTAGIAYNTNIVMVHASDGVVFLSSKSVHGVADAYVLGADDADVKIISMSMGSIFGSSQIRDALTYAYNNGKLMFCAAGTTTEELAGFVGVIFPANQPQVVAVTGIKDNLTEHCLDCHVGDKVDYVIVMEKTSTGRNPLSVAMSGDIPSTVGGSSVATSSCSGIAALVWAKHPTYPRDSILARMTRAASNFGNRDAEFGWGVVNADVAVGQ